MLLSPVGSGSLQDEVRTLQTQLEETRRWNASLQARLQQQTSNQRGGGVGGDSPHKITESTRNNKSTPGTSVLYDTFGRCYLYYLFCVPSVTHC